AKDSKSNDGGPGYLPEDKLREIYEKHYNQILPIMAEQVHKEKFQGVRTRLTYSESSRRNTQTRGETQLSESESFDRRKRPKKKRKPSPITASRDTCLSQSASVFSSLRREGAKPARQRSPVSTTAQKSRRGVDMRAKDEVLALAVSEKERSKENGIQPTVQPQTTHLSENKHDKGEHWKSKKQRSTSEEDLSQPWLCEETDPFTARIHNFEVPKRTRMPTNVKTHDGTGDPENHLKIFQTAAKSGDGPCPRGAIYSYEILQKAFLGNFSQQKKYIKDPVEIHHIKQREGESTEAFMESFKAESMHVNGAPKCMRISEFMHGITNPDLIKRLNDNILKSVDEMMNMTTAFLRGEVAIEEPVKSGQLSHLVKELKQGANKGEHAKAAKKEKPPTKKNLRQSLWFNPGSG
ncbi:hypothetical protein Tco_0040665, partial [Tanacetum coccineum]